MDRLKSDVLEKLDEAVSQGLVDDELLPLLSTFNGIEGVVTTSSCSGRYQLISFPTAGDKLGSEVMAKWHRTIELKDIEEALERWNGEGELHFMVQSLLFHIRTKDLQTAVKLRNMGQDAGMKFSTIRSMKLDQAGRTERWGIVVELLGTERMEIPLEGIPPDVIKQCLGPWIKRGNALIRRTKEHIPQLLELTRERFY